MRPLVVGAVLVALIGTARAQTSYVLACGPSGCTADDGSAEPAGAALNRETWSMTPMAADPTRVYVPDTGQPLVVTPRQLAAQAALPHVTGGITLSPDKSRLIASTSDGTLDPGSSQPSCLAAAGNVTNCKKWVGQVVTTANGAFTFDYTNAGFTSPPRVRLQAMSTASQIYIAAPQMPTTTSDSGTVYAPTSTGTFNALGAVLTLFPPAAAGVVVQLTANGS